MFSTVLIANRGEIAVRNIRTLKQMGIRNMAVYAHPNRHSQHVERAGQLAVKIVEFEINASATISALHCEPGKAFSPGEPLISIAI
ncbi:biotin carboxylase N-terminal domain-containing protein [Marinobacter changyiensis]|uniref:biotin carboxylase N-terminal domain-containing protein n=1 Tax=Marinobacter changyiensis TaxID=2604091 RepID=UPI001264FDE1|nr:biotin carboxylase N-terminal domain-containing protein [Marinobacter changyiensis]